MARRRETVIGLVPQAPWIIEASHLGKQQGLHLGELRRVFRIGGEVELVSRGLRAGEGDDRRSTMLGQEFIRIFP